MSKNGIELEIKNMEVDRNKGVSQGEGKSDPSKMILGDLAKHVEEKVSVVTIFNSFIG